MKSSPPPAGSTAAWRAYSSRPDVACGVPASSGRARPPAHPVHRRTRAPVERFAGDDEALLLVEANGPHVVCVDVQIEAAGRYPLGFGDERGRHALALDLRCHHDLVEIEARRIDGDETDQHVVRFGHRDRRHRHELVAPALPPPIDPRVKIDPGIGELPGAPPQLDRCVFVGGRIGAQLECRCAHRSVNLSSIRRLRPKASSVLSGSMGWNSPKPAATSRCGKTPLLMRYCTTEIARPTESSQLFLNCGL